jgi:hypothetical protein
MPQWRAPPSLLGTDPTSLLQQPGRAFDAQQLQALARRQQLMQPLSSSPADVDAGSPLDPNFRQLISRPQDATQRTPGYGPPATPDTSSRVALNVPPVAFSISERRNNDVRVRPPEESSNTGNVVPIGAMSEALRGLTSIAPFHPPADPVHPSGPAKFPKEFTPKLPLAMKLWWAAPGIYPEMLRQGLGIYQNNQSGAKEREEEEVDCAERAADEINRCYKRKWKIVHRDYLHGCIQRAKTRQDMCRRNGGKPRPDEPPEWGDPDEETGLNLHR